MRVTNQMSMNAMKLYLSQNMSSLTKSQEMLASGHRINKTSDDPIGAINTMRFTTNIVETEEYIEKIDQSTNFMNTTDSALNNVNSVLQRVRELVVYAANGTQNDVSRNAISDELKQLREQLNLIANTTYGSKNIFSGTNVTTSPYDAENDVWRGNTDALNLEIGTGVKIQINSIMQNFFYNTGSTMSGQSVDLSRLTDTSQMANKTFNLVFDDLQEKSRFVTITQQDIDNAGWGHPSAKDFVSVVQSSLTAAGSTDVFDYNAVTDTFTMNGTQVYMKTSGGDTIDKANTVDTLGVPTTNNLAQLQNHSDLAGTLSFYTDAACTTPYTTASTVINDTTDIAKATGWTSSITRKQFNTIVTGMAKTSGYELAYDNASGTYTLDGVAGKLQVGGVDVNDTFLKTVDDHSALNGKTISFVAASTGTATNLGTGPVSDTEIATTDWGLSPTDDQYKDMLQNAIDRSLGLLPTGNSKVLVEGSQSAGYSLKVIDSSLLPADGSPSQVKIRTLGTESLGTIGNAAAAMPLDETSLSQTVISYFSDLNPTGKYSVTYDAAADQFSISVDGGITYKTGNIVLVDQDGNKQNIDVTTFLAGSPTASSLLGKKIEFLEDGAGGNTWPVTNPEQPAVTAEDLKPTTILTMNGAQFRANMTAFFNNLFSGHTLDIDTSVPPKITGIDGITGTISIGGKTINDVASYVADLTAKGEDFSDLIGQEVVFTPDNSVINNNQITYVDASTGNQVKESSAAFTMGGQGLKGRGVRYQDDNIGVMQLLDRIVIDVQAGNHDNIDSNLSVIDDRMDALNSERSVIGARVNRLELQKDRMETSKENYTSLLSRYQDADMAQVIMDLNMQENVYRASLAAGARIIMPSLMDYLS